MSLLALILACAEPAGDAAGRAPATPTTGLHDLDEGEITRAIAEGRLREAADLATRLRETHPERLDGWLLGAKALRARRDRRGVLTLLQEAYARQPAGFPALRELVDHTLAGPESAARGREAQALLAAHRAAHPGDADRVTVASLMVTAYLLGQSDLDAASRAQLTQDAEALLAATASTSGAAYPYVHADRADVLVGLGRLAEALPEAQAAATDAPEVWTVYTQRWGAVCILFHLGRDAEARAALAALAADVRAWEGLHFGMTKPLWSWIRLTAWLRTGERLPDLPREATIDARALSEGIQPQYGDAEVRAGVGRVLAAEDAALPSVAADVDALIGVLARDRGCEMENRVIRPHARALLHVLRARIHAQEGDLPAASAQIRAANDALPGDPWLATLTPVTVGSVGR